jgi:hypothetical protein
MIKAPSPHNETTRTYMRSALHVALHENKGSCEKRVVRERFKETHTQTLAPTNS